MPFEDKISDEDAAAAVTSFSSGAKPVDPNRMRATVATALDTNPDQHAEALNLSRKTGVPVSSVLADKDNVAKSAKLDSFDFKAFAKTNPVTTELMSDEQFAKLAVDDIDNMGAVETAFSKLKNVGTALRVGVGPSLNVGVLGVLENNAAIKKQLGFSFIPSLNPMMGRAAEVRGQADQEAEAYSALRKYEQKRADTLMAPILNDAGPKERAVYSGITSVGQQAPGIIASVVTRNPEFALAAAGATTFGTSAAEGMDRGLSPVQAMGYGLRDGFVEVGTELLPVTKLVGDLKAGAPLLKTLLHQAATEVPGELMATTLQNFNEWATLNPDEPFSKYLDSLPGDLRDTVISTVVGVGAQTGAMHVTNKAINSVTQRSQRAQWSQDAHDVLAKIQQLASVSKVLERNPQSFETFIKNNTEGTEIEDVYIDPKELQQSGIDVNALAAMSPSVAKQIAAANETGSLLRIPVSEYATNVAATDLGQPLLDVLKTDPFAMSRNEATNFMQTQSAELESQVEKQLQGRHLDDQAQQSRSVVEKNILGQLQTSGRFTPDVNNLYSKLMSNFYHVIGSRAGQTAEQMFAKYPVGIQAEGAQATDLSKAFFDTPPVDNQGNITLDHWSSERGLSMADPKQWGKNKTFLPKDERNRIGVAPGRTYFGIASNQDGGYRPESGLGSVRYRASIPASKLYDMASDPENLKARGRELLAQKATQLDGKSLYEHLIQDAGYSGYWIKGPAGLTAAVFDPLSLAPYTADRGDLTPGNVTKLLTKSNWAILTAENPAAQATSPEENKQRNAALAEYLKQQGIDFEPVVGQYGNRENSFFLFGVNPEEANAIGKQFGQESVLIPQGLLYSDMTLERATGLTEHKPNDLPDDFYTVIPATGAAFTVDINFENRVPFGELAQSATNNTPYRDGLGFYSAVEKAVLDMRTTGWEPSRKSLLDDKQREELVSLRGLVASTKDPKYARLLELAAVERKEKGVAKGSELWAKIQKLPVKKEELQWLGLEEYLQSQPDFTREEVSDFIRQNGVRVEEIVADQEIDDKLGDWSDLASIEDDDYINSEQEYWEEQMTEDGDQSDLYFDAVDRVVRKRETFIEDKIGDNTGNQDWLDKARKVAIDEFEDEVSTQVSAIAYDNAYQSYWDNPIKEAVNSNGDVIRGNDDLGYSLNGDFLDAYSFNEAQVKASEKLGDNGEYVPEDSPYAKRWEQYVTDGRFTNYRERKLTLPGIENEFFNNTHFDDANIVAFTRETDRVFTVAQDAPTEEQAAALKSLEDKLATDFSKEKEQEAYDTSAAAVRESYLLAGLPVDEEAISNYGGWRFIAEENMLPVEEKALAASKEAGGVNGTYEAQLKATEDRVRIRSTSQDYQFFFYAKQKLERDIEKLKIESTKRSVKAFFIDEFQSDWHQHGRQQGYSTGLDAGEVEALAQEKLALARSASAEMFAEYQHGPLFDEGVNKGVAAIEGLFALRDQVKEYLTGDTATHSDGSPLSADTIEANMQRFGKTVFDIVSSLRKPEKLQGTLIEKAFTADEAKAALDVFAKNTNKGRYILDLLDEADGKFDQAKAERNGVPDAPFKGDSWIALGLKRALTSAVEEGYARFAWADAGVLSERWSERYRTLYETQYDTKMPSIVKRLTSIAPVHVEADEDATLEGSGYWYIDITPELAAKVKNEGMALFQKQRGSFNPQTSMITLLNAADLSTFLHEAGHFFLETMNKMAQDPASPQQIKDDMNLALKWMGASDLADWNSRTLEQQREGHEKFARGFEAYLFEGKAPNIELAGVFSRFRDWLVSIYKEIRNLKADLNQDIRGVFDRLVATDEMIKESETLANFQPLFATMEEAGMNADEWALYQQLGLSSTEQAKENLQSRGLRDMKWLSNAKSRVLKEMQRSVEGKRKAIRRQVTEEVMGEPINQARQFIRRGIGANGLRVEGPHRIDVDALREMYGDGPDALWRALDSKYGKYGVLGQNGVHPDALADQFGFSSGDELMKALASAENPSDRIAGLTDQRMLEQYGDIADPKSLERAAEAAIHNDARIRFVASEMNALQRATGKRQILNKAAKQFAEQMIGRLRVRDLKPSRYQAAEVKAARAASEAMRKNDLDTAAIEKRNQLVQMQAAKAALNAQEEIEKALTYLKKFNKVSKTLDPAYRDQIDALLERFDLKPASLKAIDKRKSLVDWVASLEEQGLEPDVPQEILDAANRKHYKDMTVEEMRGLIDTIRQIEHLGRLKNKLLTAKRERDFATAVDGLVTSIDANSKGRTADNVTRPTKWDGFKRLFKGYLAQHRKLASFARQMDGVKDGGQMWEVFIRSMNNAGNMEAVKREQATMQLATIAAPLMQGKQKMGGKGIFFDKIGRSLNREERLSIILNLGNESNKQRLLDGFNWTEDQLQQVLDTITPEEANFAQAVWDHFESYRPDIAAKEKRIYGKEPEWIEPSPITLGGVDLRGGYYPVKYDHRQSGIAEQHDMAEVARQQLRGAYTSSTTRRSFTKSRADEVKGRPLMLTMDSLYAGVNEVIHDLSWHEWLIDANRLMRNKALDQAIRGTYGAEVVQQMKEAIKDIAAGEMPSGGAFEKTMANLRAGATVAGLGLKISTALMNITGITQSFVRVGPRWVIQGLDAWARSPVQLVTDVYGKSDFMRLRGKTMQREINEVQSMLRDKSKTRAAIDRISFLPLTYTQMVIDMPTWWGAYQKALAAGEVEERAVALADQSVLDAQGGGQVKDLAGIQRGNPILKLFTTFYGYFSTTWQLTVEQTSKTNFKDPLDVMRLAGDYFLLYVVPATLGTIVHGIASGDDDWADPEKLAKRYAHEQISFAFGMLIGARETSAAVEKALGVNQYDFSYGGPAGLRFFSELDKLGSQIGQGEFDTALRRSLVNVAGVTLRLPSTQINKTLDGAVAMMNGDTANPASLIFGPPEQ